LAIWERRLPRPTIRTANWERIVSTYPSADPGRIPNTSKSVPEGAISEVFGNGMRIWSASCFDRLEDLIGNAPDAPRDSLAGQSALGVGWIAQILESPQRAT
jgi:hypothetical protein